jgi:shikimate dehydrogenase
MDKYGLIGYPLGHSFSMNFFNQKFESEYLNAQYQNFEIKNIEEFPEVLLRNPNLKGLNVTIPYKQKIISYLDDISKEARNIGAVNVIKITRKGNSMKLRGYNSDVLGFTQSIKPMLKPHHKKALILGTGGASKAIHYGLTEMLGMEAMYVSRFHRPGTTTYESIDKEALSEYEVIINCTPCGMFPNVDECPNIPYQYLTSNNLLYDLIYNPDETLFMQKGAQYGATVKNGLEMLILQAQESWKIWNND